MSAPQHTPGPWTWRRTGTGYYVVEGGPLLGVPKKPGLIARVASDIDGVWCEDNEDNARLIAAAPAMYEALTEMMREYEPPSGEVSDAVVLARSALKTARGES